MFTQNEKYKKIILSLILKNNNIIFSTSDAGARVFYCNNSLLCALLYKQPVTSCYNVELTKNNFCQIDYEKRKKINVNDRVVGFNQVETKIDRSVFANWPDTLEAVKEYAMTMDSHTAIIPTDIGLIIMGKSYNNGEGCVISWLNIQTWSDENAELIRKYLEATIRTSTSNPRELENTYNIAILNGFGITTKKMAFRPVDCDIKKNYNDTLQYDKISAMLNDDKQHLIMFHGKAGTGKTTLIKKIINDNLDKKVVVVDNNILTTIADDKCLSFLSNNSNSIMILEDCDKALRKRESGNNVMSTILNLTDGLIGETFGIKFICTFNTSLDDVDPALLRKGRLSLMYEFKPLTVDKVRAFIPDATEPMTVAEIYNREDNNYKEKDTKIGF